MSDVGAAAVGYGQPVLAIIEVINRFGAVRFYRAARGAGLTPLLGTEVML